MSDDPSGWGGGGEPTVPVERVPGDGGDGGPPTVAQPVFDDGEPPRRTNWLVLALLGLLVMIAVLTAVLLLGDDAGDDDAGGSTTSTEVAADETTTSSTGAPSTTAPSTSTTAPSTTTAPPTTAATTAPTTSTTAPPSTAPQVTTLTAGEPSCPGSVELSWTTVNAVSVEIAIDNPGGVYDTGPPNGSLMVPSPCDGDTQTYFVTAIAANGDRLTDELVLVS